MLPSRTLRRRDDALSEVLAVVVMVSLAVVLASILFLWVGVEEDEGVAPVTVNLTTDDFVSRGTIVFTVTSVSGVLNWSEVTLEIDGRRLAYDHELSGANKFCVTRGESACINTISWNPRTLRVAPGQMLYVHDDAIDGKTFRLVHTATGAPIMAHVVPAEA